MTGWSAEQIPDQAGRRVIVTGANSGIGLQAARALALHGADVTLACRDTAKGEQAAASIREQAPAATVAVRQLDLADLASVRAFAAETDAVDLLINNAGVMALPARTTADGFEMQLGTNHLGHFALTGLVAPTLLGGTAPRVVTISSGAHKFGKIDFDDLQSELRYRRWSAYGQSKLANLLFALELARRAAAADVDLISVAAHPGYASTHLQAAGPEMEGAGLRKRFMALSNTVFAQSDAQGALPTLFAATQELPGGSYIGPGGPGEMRGPPKLVRPNSAARNEVTARRLWEVSERLTGVTFDLGPRGSSHTDAAQRRQAPA